MKRMKVLVLVFLAFGMQAIAQNTTEEKAKKMTDRLSAQVELTEQQKIDVTAINTDFVIQLKELRILQVDNREAFHKLHKDRRTKVMAQLNDDQKAVLKEKRKEQHDIRKKLRKEITEYRKANIAPVLIEKRGAFEEKLSAEEKQTIEQLRLQMEEKKMAWKAKSRDQKKEHRKNMDANFKEKRKEERKAMKEQLKPILENHKADLDSIEKEITPLKKKWETDIKAIKGKYEIEGRDDGGPHMHKRGKGKKHKMGKHSGSMKVKFLLMNPAQPVEEKVGED
jgi:hypothetical protein